jgi:hypothetical protein
MRIYNEILDSLDLSEPKQVARFVRPTGEIEVLKPLAGSASFIKSGAASGFLETQRAYRLSGFHRALALGGGLAMAVLMLATGIHFWIFGAPADPVGLSDLAMQVRPDGVTAAEDFLTIDDEPAVSDIAPDADPPVGFFETPAAVPAVARRSRVRSRVPRAVYRTRRDLYPSPLWVSRFIPTTVVIYIENGEIKTRTEPRPSAAFKKS